MDISDFLKGFGVDMSKYESEEPGWAESAFGLLHYEHISDEEGLANWSKCQEISLNDMNTVISANRDACFKVTCIYNKRGPHPYHRNVYFIRAEYLIPFITEEHYLQRGFQKILTVEVISCEDIPNVSPEEIKSQNMFGLDNDFIRQYLPHSLKDMLGKIKI